MHDRITALLDLDGFVVAREHPELHSSLKRLCLEGRLIRLFPGVFGEPSLLDVGLRLRALCRSVPGGVLHGRTAAAVWLEDGVAAPFELAVRGRPAPRHGVVYLLREVPSVVRGGLRLVPPAYCAAELACSDDGRCAFRMLRGGLVTPDTLLSAGASLRRTPGNQERSRVLRALATNPWSPAERMFHRLLERHRIDGWRANAVLRIEGRKILPDALFDAERLVVEVDGYAFHATREQLQRDLDRQNILASAGYRVLRFTWADLTERPEEVIRRLQKTRRDPIAPQVGTDWLG